MLSFMLVMQPISQCPSRVGKSTFLLDSAMRGFNYFDSKKWLNQIFTGKKFDDHIVHQIVTKKKRFQNEYFF